MRTLLIIYGLAILSNSLYGQTPAGFQFALVTDTHIGNATSAEDLRRTVADINASDSLAFAIFSGDITEFGSDAELNLARQILDSLTKPWYIVPGNHDAKWSESGGNSFRKIFGAETFSFGYGSFLFIGTNSGPNMRMGPGQIPRENIVWLDSLLDATPERKTPIIFINHYPLDPGLNNWYEVVDRLKSRNIQLILCGHGHSDRIMDTEGIPGLMSRSNLRASEAVGGYNIMRVSGDTLLTASVRRPALKTQAPWAKVILSDHKFTGSTTDYPRPDFSVNGLHPDVREVWRREEKSDIGAGVAMAAGIIVSAGTDGFIKAQRLRNGKPKWQYRTGSKIYGTPDAGGDRVIVSATDGTVYALSIRSGRLLWKFDAGERIVASPVINDEQVVITGSGGKCYSLSLEDGSIQWLNETIEGFVETTPLIYKSLILFGTWGNRFYALDAKTGVTRWIWNDGYQNRMLSPAACVPAAVDNRIFFVAPDRKMTCLDASTGKTIWQSKIGDHSVRESMGLSTDSTLVLAKTMEGNIIGVSADGSPGDVRWKADTNIGYDIAPSVVVENEGVVYVPSDKGFIYAISRNSGELIWAHRISACLITQILPVSPHSVVCTSMDGVITRLSYSPGD
jgi:outer membrane protein assembly factor BamB/predicted phosphodiesterase